MSIEHNESSAGDAEEALFTYELELKHDGRVSVMGQAMLRELLKADLPAGRQGRLISLLNPRGSRVVELSDSDFRKSYFITAEDNYGRISGEWDSWAVFDAMHGYYVHPLVLPLPSQRESIE